MRELLLPLLVLLVFASAASADQIIIIKERTGSDGLTTFDMEHSEEYVLDAIEELTGSRPPENVNREDLALATLELLNDLPPYGQKQTQEIRPAIPRWFLTGYTRLQPRFVAHSRYLDAVIEGSLLPSSDIGALYAFWCMYDAEWFALSRNAGYKAWLSAVMLSYPPHWQRLHTEPEWTLHDRLVAPLQTPDEPYREIDNWINNFSKSNGAFVKPKVRDALVKELLAQAGMETDERFYDDEAYGGPTPRGLGLADREFFLLAALCLEYFQEIYELEPDGKQALHFRDYFLGVFHQQARQEHH
ncbi:hypothetical protein IIA79_01440 [bacterium]|nr:hypothetical protein [bacterium]